MPMTPDQQAKHVAEGSAANNLADRIVAFNAAASALAGAQNALTTAADNLTAAWTAAKQADQALSDVVFVPPAGWTPSANRVEWSPAGRSPRLAFSLVGLQALPPRGSSGLGGLFYARAW